MLEPDIRPVTAVFGDEIAPIQPAIGFFAVTGPMKQRDEFTHVECKCAKY